MFNKNHSPIHSWETDRILNLPLIQGNPSPEDLTKIFKSKDGTQVLRPVQAAILYQFCLGAAHGRGAFCPVAVGEGKTLPSLLIASVAQAIGKKRTMLFTRPDLKAKTFDDIRFYAPHWSWRRDVCTVPMSRRLKPAPTPYSGTWQNPNTGLWYNFQDSRPIHIFFNEKWVDYNPYGHVAPDGTVYEVGFPRDGRCTVQTYNDLSNSDRDTGEPKLDLMKAKPDLMVFDEIHCLSNSNSTRTMRVSAYLEAYPDTLVVGLSGTLTTRSIFDYEHLAKWCLRHYSPLPFVTRDKWIFHKTGLPSYPLTHEDLQCYSAVLDSSKTSDPTPREYLVIDPIRQRFAAPEDYASAGLEEKDFPYGPYKAKTHIVRNAYRRRLVMIPGVVATSVSSLKIPAVFELAHVDVPDEVVLTINKMSKEWQSADGSEIISDASVMAAAKRHLSAGFFYKPIRPNGVSDEEWTRWVTFKRNWHSEARNLMNANIRGVDSLMLIALACRRVLQDRGLLAPDTEYQDSYDSEYRDEDTEDDVQAIVKETSSKYEPSPQLVEAYHNWTKVMSMPKPSIEAVWVSKFLIHRIEELINNRLADVPTIIWYQHRAVEEALASIKYKGKHLKVFGKGKKPPEKAITCAMSIKVHGQGKNLQAWHSNILAELPPNGKIMEQLIGRTHRTGQDADEVRFLYFGHTDSYKDALEQAKSDAEYQSATLGPQKLTTQVVWVK